MSCNGIQRFYYVQKLVRCSSSRHGSDMRAALLILLAATPWAREAFGVWKLNPARSTPVGNQKTMTLRIEQHTRGEVFTLDTVTSDGRASTSSTILYLDDRARNFRDQGCFGTQSSRRLDDRTVEILRRCATGERTRIVCRLTARSELVLEVTAKQADGREVERRLVFEKE